MCGFGYNRTSRIAQPSGSFFVDEKGAFFDETERKCVAVTIGRRNSTISPSLTNEPYGRKRFVDV